MKGEVLVKARPRIQYDMSGKPSMYFEQGGSGQRGLPSKRERVAGALGGAVGVLGGLTGKHRSLGGLLGSMYAGAVQGEGVGRSIAGKTVGRGRRAELALEEQSRAKQGRDKGVERMKRRVERAEEAQDRINAPAGANTQGVVSQLRDKVRVRRTPQYMRDDFRTAEAAEAEREAEEQAKQQRRELSRQDLARARSLRDLSPAQIEELGRIEPERLEQLRHVEAILSGNVPSTYAAVSPSPPLGQLAPNAQPAPQVSIPPPQGGVANEATRDNQMHPSGNADNFDHDAELLNQSSPNNPQELGRELATQEPEPANVGQLSADQLERLLLLGQQNQQTGQTQ
jgi:hypothetical protein